MTVYQIKKWWPNNIITGEWTETKQNNNKKNVKFDTFNLLNYV